MVTDNDKRPLVRLTLTESLDTVIVSDKDVYHQVEPIEVAPGESEGYRDVLLIDFTPMHPVTLRAPQPMLPAYDSPRAEPTPQPESSSQEHAV